MHLILCQAQYNCNSFVVLQKLERCKNCDNEYNSSELIDGYCKSCQDELKQTPKEKPKEIPKEKPKDDIVDLIIDETIKSYEKAKKWRLYHQT